MKKTKFQKGDVVMVDGHEYTITSVHMDDEWPHALYVLEDEEGFIHAYDTDIVLKDVDQAPKV